MKNSVPVLLCLIACAALSAPYPCQATSAETIQICNCDTEVLDMEIYSMEAEMTATMSELIDACASGGLKIRAFRRCVSKLTRGWQLDGLIDSRQRRDIRRCSRRNRKIQTVDYVDVAQYLGLWYQIAAYIDPRIGDLAGVTAEYSLNPDGTVKVLNTGIIGGLDGTPIEIEGVARVVDAKTNAKLAVSFPDFGITDESDYWIIALGQGYSYAVVTNSRRSSLFILSRTPTMDESLYQLIIEQLVKRCFDPERIVRTVQPEE